MSDQTSLSGPVFRPFLEILGSQVTQAIVGLAGLPLLVRNLGSAQYGRFSLYLLTISTLITLDFARPLMIVDYISADALRSAALEWIAWLSGGFLVIASFAIGFFLFEPMEQLALCITTALFAVASADYSWLATHGRVGTVNLLRNLGWTLAYLAVVGLSFLPSIGTAYVWPFVVCMALLVPTYRLLSQRVHTTHAFSRGRAAARPYYAKIRDLMVSNTAVSVITSADRYALQRFGRADVFGSYTAQMDLAIKANSASTSVSQVLYPHYARVRYEEGDDRADQRFVSLSGRIILVYALILLGAMILSRPLLGVVLGSDFDRDHHLMPLFLYGVFLHLLGFLAVPSQRARADFATQRRAYIFAAVLCGLAAVLLVPRWPLMGAVVTYFCAFSSDLWMAAKELPALAADPRRRRKLASLAGLLTALGTVAIWQATWT